MTAGPGKVDDRTSKTPQTHWWSFSRLQSSRSCHCAIRSNYIYLSPRLPYCESQLGSLSVVPFWNEDRTSARVSAQVSEAPLAPYPSFLLDGQIPRGSVRRDL